MNFGSNSSSDESDSTEKYLFQRMDSNSKYVNRHREWQTLLSMVWYFLRNDEIVTTHNNIIFANMFVARSNRLKKTASRIDDETETSSESISSSLVRIWFKPGLRRRELGLLCLEIHEELLQQEAGRRLLTCVRVHILKQSLLPEKLLLLSLQLLALLLPGMFNSRKYKIQKNCKMTL